MYIITYYIIFSGVFITQFHLIIGMITMSLLHVHVVNLAKTCTFFFLLQLLELLDLKDQYFPQFQGWLEDVVLPVYKRLMQEAGTSDSVEGNGQEMISTLTHLLERVAEDPRKVKNKF